ncbi:MAG: DUF6348 family protein [Promethearchaeota archaeon]
MSLEYANEKLLALHKQHFKDSYLHQDGWIVCDKHVIKVARIDFIENNGKYSHGQVDFAIQDTSREAIFIFESFVGFGSDKESIIDNALYNFAISDLQMLFSTLNDFKSDQISIEKWKINSIKYRAHFGRAITKYSKEINNYQEMPFFEVVEKFLKQQDFTKKSYWIRIYIGKVPGQEPILEFVLNNEPYIDGIKALQQVEWKEKEDFYSFRLFLILKPY